MGQVSKPRPLHHYLTSLQHLAAKVEQGTARLLFFLLYQGTPSLHGCLRVVGGGSNGGIADDDLFLLRSK